jgi:hypothetical protein
LPRRTPVPDAEDENYAALTDEERRAVASLQRLAKRWPQSLKLISMEGSLGVIRTADPRWVDDTKPSFERQAAIIADIDGIPNDGGAW